MNRTSAKRGIKALFAMFLLVGGLLFVSNNVNAQSAPPKLDIAGIVWMTESQALDVLTGTVESIHQAMGTYIPGSPVYNAAVRRAFFLKGIHRNVEGGMSVPNALLEVYGMYDDGSLVASADQAQVLFTPAQSLEEANFAISLLRTN